MLSGSSKQSEKGIEAGSAEALGSSRVRRDTNARGSGGLMALKGKNKRCRQAVGGSGGRFNGGLRHVDNFVGFLTQGTTLRMFARPRLLRQKLVHRAFHDLRAYQEDSRWPGWQVIVGIETHAQLKSRRKLFSGIRVVCSPFCRDLTRSTEGLIGNLEDAPNTHVASFDAAYPGTLPV